MNDKELKELKQLEEDAKKVPDNYERNEGKSPIYEFMRKRAFEKKVDKMLDWLEKEASSLTPAEDYWYLGYLEGYRKSLEDLKGYMTEEQKQKLEEI